MSAAPCSRRAFDRITRDIKRACSAIVRENERRADIEGPRAGTGERTIVDAFLASLDEHAYYWQGDADTLREHCAGIDDARFADEYLQTLSARADRVASVSGEPDTWTEVRDAREALLASAAAEPGRIVLGGRALESWLAGPGAAVTMARFTLQACTCEIDRRTLLRAVRSLLANRRTRSSEIAIVAHVHETGLTQLRFVARWATGHLRLWLYLLPTSSEATSMHVNLDNARTSVQIVSIEPVDNVSTQPARVASRQDEPMEKKNTKPTATPTEPVAPAPAKATSMLDDLEAYGWNAATFRQSKGRLVVLYMAETKKKIAEGKGATMREAYAAARKAALKDDEQTI